MYARITGVGACLPERIVTNAELEQKVDTTDAWIRARTGIAQRHVTWPQRPPAGRGPPRAAPPRRLT